jgi:sucrose-6-phosphate hydrolase SacC (GH32 family)
LGDTRFIRAPIAGSLEHHWVLIVGVGDGRPASGSAPQYFFGQFDCATLLSQNLPEIVFWFDYGADYYVTQSWSDESQGGRVKLAGWGTGNTLP